MRKSRPMSIEIKCMGNEYPDKSAIRLSVRNQDVSLFVRGPDMWPHMDKDQALRLANWLLEAVDEIDARMEARRSRHAHVTEQGDRT